MNEDRYEAARVAGRLVVFVGWLAFAGGIVATLTAGAAGGTVAHRIELRPPPKWRGFHAETPGPVS